MNHHYLPVFYLKHFTDPNTPAGHQPFVWAFQDDKWKAKAPKNIAFMPDFYAFKDQDGNVDQRYESIFQQLESYMAPALSRIANERPNSITPDERVFLSYFLVTMQQRTPPFLTRLADEVERQMKQSYRDLFDSFGNDIQKFEEFKQNLRKDGDDQKYTNVTLDQVTPDIYDQFSVRPVTAFTISRLMTLWQDLAAIVYSMKWKLVYSDSPVFITSESPISIQLLSGENSFHNIEISAPLSPKRALLCSWRFKHDYVLSKATQKDVWNINMRTLVNPGEVSDNKIPKVDIISASKKFPNAQLLEEIARERRAGAIVTSGPTPISELLN